jgi:3-oxoacyl-[acyl-carrier-protein] synthase-1
MSDSQPLAILNCGLVTAAGLSAPSACAAIRAGVANPTLTRFTDSAGKWLMAHQVPLEQPWRGLTKLVRMASMAIIECLADVPQEEWPRIPLLLCVAERERPGRLAGLDDELFGELQRALGLEFAPQSLIIPQGRVGAGIALRHARRLIAESGVPRVLIAATDSLLSAATLATYERRRRLLTDGNSNGFMPGEGAGAVLVGRAGSQPALLCMGLGFGMEPANIDSEEPLRGDGLARAIKEALAEAGCALHDLDFRITDISGEQYYFKEAALALARVLRGHKDEFDLWHPAESVGELGAAAGPALLAVADAACRKGNAPGPRILCHAACDSGQRAATVLQFGSLQ